MMWLCVCVCVGKSEEEERRKIKLDKKTHTYHKIINSEHNYRI